MRLGGKRTPGWYHFFSWAGVRIASIQEVLSNKMGLRREIAIGVPTIRCESAQMRTEGPVRNLREKVIIKDFTVEGGQRNHISSAVKTRSFNLSFRRRTITGGEQSVKPGEEATETETTGSWLFGINERIGSDYQVGINRGVRMTDQKSTTRSDWRASRKLRGSQGVLCGT